MSGNFDNYDIESLVCKVNSLQKQLYGNIYKKVLPDKLVYVIPPYVHKLLAIRGYLFLSPAGKEIEISFQLLSDKSVQLESNTSMLGCTLILF